MEGLLLGSGGWIPTSRRETCAAYVREGAHVLLLDAGTGIQRLLERPELMEGVERVDLLLTHFHLDHIVGLAYLPALPLRPVVWGPGRMLAGTPTHDLLERLLGRPLFSAPLDAIAADVRELEEGAVPLETFEVSARVQERHSEPTLAFRLGDLLTYCTDTAPDPGTAPFAAGSRVLLHEAWHAADTSDDPTHTASGDAGRIAREAGVERLVLIHVSPLPGVESELLTAASAVFPEVEVGSDLASIPSS
jgi:ribonuclease BN (tRNA processing enzyme)